MTKPNYMRLVQIALDAAPMVSVHSLETHRLEFTPSVVLTMFELIETLGEALLIANAFKDQSSTFVKSVPKAIECYKEYLGEQND